MQIDLKALLNLTELEITSVEMTDDALRIKCRSSLGQAICPSCNKKNHQIRKYYRRSIRDLPISVNFIVPIVMGVSVTAFRL